MEKIMNAIATFLRKQFASSTATYRYGRCPGCKQRIRFLAHKAGRAGECPRCAKRFPLTTNATAGV